MSAATATAASAREAINGPLEGGRRRTDGSERVSIKTLALVRNSLKVAGLRGTWPLIACVDAIDIECRRQGLLDEPPDSLRDRLGLGELATVRASAWRTDDDGDVVSRHGGSGSRPEVDSSTVVEC
jgi:hypothetical protein